MSFYTRAYNTFEFAVFWAIRSTSTYLPFGPSVSTLCTLALVSDSDTMGTRFHPSGLYTEPFPTVGISPRTSTPKARYLSGVASYPLRRQSSMHGRFSALGQSAIDCFVRYVQNSYRRISVWTFIVHSRKSHTMMKGALWAKRSVNLIVSRYGTAEDTPPPEEAQLIPDLPGINWAMLI